MAVAERTQTFRRTGAKLPSHWHDPPEHVQHQDLWYEAVNEVQEAVGEHHAHPGGILPSEHSATALFALTKVADKMIREARESSEGGLSVPTSG